MFTTTYAAVHHYFFSSCLLFSATSYGFPIPQPKAEVAAGHIATVQVSAAQNSPQAQYLYGLLLLSGRIINKDAGQGLYWLTKAAEPGHKKSQKTVADLAFEGRLIPRDPVTAEKWYSELGNSRAHFRLGFIYAAGGDGVKEPSQNNFPVLLSFIFGLYKAQKARCSHYRHTKLSLLRFCISFRQRRNALFKERKNKHSPKGYA